MISLDTDVLVRYLVEDDARQAALAASLIERVIVQHGVEQSTEEPDAECANRQPDGQVKAEVGFGIQAILQHGAEAWQPPFVRWYR